MLHSTVLFTQLHEGARSCPGQGGSQTLRVHSQWPSEDLGSISPEEEPLKRQESPPSPGSSHPDPEGNAATGPGRLALAEGEGRTGGLRSRVSSSAALSASACPLPSYLGLQATACWKATFRPVVTCAVRYVRWLQ